MNHRGEQLPPDREPEPEVAAPIVNRLEGILKEQTGSFAGILSKAGIPPNELATPSTIAKARAAILLHCMGDKCLGDKGAWIKSAAEKIAGGTGSKGYGNASGGTTITLSENLSTWEHFDKYLAEFHDKGGLDETLMAYFFGVLGRTETEGVFEGNMLAFKQGTLTIGGLLKTQPEVFARCFVRQEPKPLDSFVAA